MIKLFPYQEDGADFLVRRQHAFLADEPGLGKSAQAITACDRVDARTILVLCPASVRQTWAREFAKFSNQERKINVLFAGVRARRGCVNIASYDGAASKLREELMALRYDVLIIDEAHYLKTPEAKRTQAVYGWRDKPGFAHISARIYPLSGTPSPNNPIELYPHCKALFSEAFMKANGKPMTKFDFISRYCKTVNNGFGEKIVGGKNLEELKTRLSPYFLRRKKRDVMQDLPDVRETELYLEARASDVLLTPEIEEQMYKVRGALASKNPLQTLKLLSPHVASLRRYLGMAKVAPLAEWVTDQLAGGLEKIVIYGYHTDVLESLRFFLSKVSKVSYIDGSTVATNRDKEAQQFYDDPACKVFIGQIQAAGTGLNQLVVASDLVFAEYSWVPAENEQVIGRVDRIGQKNSPLVRYAMVAGSLDEHIARVARDKTKTIKQVFS